MPISKGMKSKLTRIRIEILEAAVPPQDSEQVILEALLAGETSIEVTFDDEEDDFTVVYDQADMAEYLDSLAYVEMAPFVQVLNVENYTRL